MKKAIILTLAVVNVALLAALVWGPTPTAHGQVSRGGTDYLMVTGQIGEDWDAVYIVDLSSRRMLAWRYDKGRRNLVPYRGRELVNDFSRQTAPQRGER